MKCSFPLTILVDDLIVHQGSSVEVDTCLLTIGSTGTVEELSRVVLSSATLEIAVAAVLQIAGEVSLTCDAGLLKIAGRVQARGPFDPRLQTGPQTYSCYVDNNGVFSVTDINVTVHGTFLNKGTLAAEDGYFRFGGESLVLFDGSSFTSSTEVLIQSGSLDAQAAVVNIHSLVCLGLCSLGPGMVSKITSHAGIIIISEALVNVSSVRVTLSGSLVIENSLDADYLSVTDGTVDARGSLQLRQLSLGRGAVKGSGAISVARCTFLVDAAVTVAIDKLIITDSVIIDEAQLQKLLTLDDDSEITFGERVTMEVLHSLVLKGDGKLIGLGKITIAGNVTGTDDVAVISHGEIEMGYGSSLTLPVLHIFGKVKTNPDSLLQVGKFQAEESSELVIEGTLRVTGDSFVNSGLSITSNLKIMSGRTVYNIPSADSNESKMGLVTVVGGILVVSGGTHDSRFEIASVIAKGGTLEILRDVNIGDLHQIGGMLDFLSECNIRNYQFDLGTLSGRGRIGKASVSSMILSGSDTRVISALKLDIQDKLIWTDTSFSTSLLTFRNNALLTTIKDTILRIEDHQEITGSGTWINKGTVQFDSVGQQNSSSFRLGIAVENRGSMDFSTQTGGHFWCKLIEPRQHRLLFGWNSQLSGTCHQYTARVER